MANYTEVMFRHCTAKGLRNTTFKPHGVALISAWSLNMLLTDILKMSIVNVLFRSIFFITTQ